MTRSDFEQINRNRIARGQQPLTFTEAPTRRQIAPLQSFQPAILAVAEKRGPSKLEEKFVHLWQANGGPVLRREFKFHPSRKWRADFAHEASKTLIEIEGGQWGTGKPCPACGQKKQGAHNRGAHFESDAEKYFEAWRLGFSVVRLTGKMLTSELLTAIIARAEKNSLTV